MKRKKLIRRTYLITLALLFSMFNVVDSPLKALSAEKMTLGAEQVNTEQPLQGSTQLPSKYDLRKLNKLTPVRDQGNSENSWAFAAYGSLESTLKTKETTDFSENNLKNRSEFDVNPKSSGNVDRGADMAIAYLSRWDGPVSENDDPYSGTSTSSPEFSAQKHVQEVLKFGYENNYTDLKKAIMKYGAVYTTMYYQDDYYNSQNKTYIYRGNKKANHAVDIVGWDDNYDRNKFSNASSGIPLLNGAFIVRNSLGSNWGDQGYFYVSYYDSLIGSENVVFNNAEPISNYSSVYQYDPLGQTTSVPFASNPNTVWFANVFTANSNDALGAVSFYTNGPNSKYEVWLYNYTKGTLTKNKILSNGTIEYAGYHTVKFANSVELTTGSKFAVAVKLNTPGENPDLLALEEPVAGYSSQAESKKGQSFVSGDGAVWTDLKETDDHSNANVCLKAFTSPKSIKSLKVDPSSTTISQGGTLPITVQAINSDGITEDVTLSVDPTSSNSKVAIVSNGQIEALSPGTAKITLTYSGKSVTINVTVSSTFELQASLNPVIVEKQKDVKVNISAAYSNGKREDITSKVSWAPDPFVTKYVAVKDGTFSGLIVGETKVTVSYLGQNLILPVKVIPQLTALTATSTTLAIDSGDQGTIQVIATSGKDSEDVSTICTAASNKTNVATITNGVITGKSPGTAVVTYTYGSKATSITVTVSPKLTKLEADKSSLSIKVNKQVTLKLKAYYSTGKTVDITQKATWTIEPGGEKYITTSKGKITGLSTGTTNIIISYQNKSITLPVSVIP